ncbi:PXMP2/4 family protein 3-like [Salvia splendens]|uniref:PXMP2/4 family protein 3-like n=1 Tax=Salvia splendens TaxID=180675 RepID=UPI001C263482|nr:PXMP2/4 family protein 3-like [Salvia splendens]
MFGLYQPAMTVVFFSVNAALQGENVGEIVARLRRDLVPTMMNGVMYWPVCDFVTFKFIPVHLQPLVVNSFSYLWTIYMTYMASLDKAGRQLTPSRIIACKSSNHTLLISTTTDLKSRGIACKPHMTDSNH